eukprot:TRINITY_DN27420_c0_g1_i1.p1 TRINITY_DN27420_c0_g1~~TRINITY_DN27420_c0_g1_i1.p1  ORF type:complete len:493 (-),score=95.52 TRINITY_DN27420_c0_g1_i1:47-1525(-)
MPKRRGGRKGTCQTDRQDRPKWLARTGPGHLAVPPERWGMQLKQWVAFVMACEITEEWDRLESEYEDVNLYHVCDSFVKPWTRNTGNSIALLMNNSSPLKLDLMVSHAWAEGMIECMIALLGRSSVMGVSLTDAIWFCAFAQYQPGDMEGDCGPGVAEQLALDPFKSVIASMPQLGMMVVHTSQSELYNRLWCVYEVNEAEMAGVTVSAAFSMMYLSSLEDDDDDDDEDGEDAKLRVHSEQAQCWSESDAAMIKRKIVEGPGYDALNKKIFDFRRASLSRMRSAWSGFYDWSQEGFGGSHEKATDFLVDVVNYAGFFIGFHCLLSFVDQVEVDNDDRDEYDQRELICERAEEVVEFFRDGFGDVQSLPPSFDQSKAKHTPNWDDVLENNEKLLSCLRDLSQFEAATGYLEMGSGGCIPAMLTNTGGIQDARHALPETLKKLFRELDANGDGKIGWQEMTSILRHLDPELTDHEMNVIFSVADKDLHTYSSKC